jgi:hypothetical protein
MKEERNEDIENSYVIKNYQKKREITSVFDVFPFLVFIIFVLTERLKKIRLNPLKFV